jgi:two-component system chemotaxis response regulator CheY
LPKAVVVDDSRAVRMILGRHLRELGYEVREAGNGQEALAIIAEERTAIDLILADWNMPVMNGFELLRTLREDSGLASIKVIMVTSEAELDQMAAALEAGANEYIMKPFNREILVEKLELLSVHR